MDQKSVPTLAQTRLTLFLFCTLASASVSARMLNGKGQLGGLEDRPMAGQLTQDQLGEIWLSWMQLKKG
jgi:hypothetical protein